MRDEPKKVILAAIILFLGSLVSGYIAQLPEQRTDGFFISDPPWSIWHYLSLILLMCALASAIAAIKLRD
jgi:hypothetical protein